MAVGADLEEEVAVALRRLERVVRILRHGDEVPGPERREAEARVEQRGAEGRRDRQAVGRHDRAEQARIGRREARVQGRRRSALHQEGDALGQRAEQPLQVAPRGGEDVERRDEARAGGHRGHARLMPAVEGHGLPGSALHGAGDAVRHRAGSARVTGEEARSGTATEGAQAEQQPAAAWARHGLAGRVFGSIARHGVVIVLS